MPANSTATCDGTKCGFSCNPGSHQCGNACASNSDAANCGTSCTVCSAPAGGTATCTSGTCGFTCNNNFHQCGTSTCAANSDASHCGGNCFNCNLPNMKTVACVSNICSNTCVNNLPVACSATQNGAPYCGSWDFESNTVEGWFAGADPASAISPNFTVSTLTAATGAHSLAVSFNGDGSTKTVARIRVKVCPNSIDLNGRTVSGQMFAVGAPGATSLVGTGAGGFFVFYDGSGTQIGITGDIPGDTVAGGFGAIAGTGVSGMTDMEIFFVIPIVWQGTLFLDNVVIQ